MHQIKCKKATRWFDDVERASARLPMGAFDGTCNYRIERSNVPTAELTTVLVQGSCVRMPLPTIHRRLHKRSKAPKVAWGSTRCCEHWTAKNRQKVTRLGPEVSDYSSLQVHCARLQEG